jgi:hypothetical protein
MSEKYWVFQNNQVIGPFGLDDLLVRPGFSGDTLICPEGRQGTEAGDWQRASLVSPIAETFSRPHSPSVSALTTKPASDLETAGDSLLVKEMTLLGSVHEKIGALGQSVVHIQETLNEHGKEFPTLRLGIEERNRQFEELALRVKNFEGMENSFNSFKENFEKLSGESQARETILEETSQSQRRSIEELIQKIDFLSQVKESNSGVEKKLEGLGQRLDALTAKVDGEFQSFAASSALDELKGIIGGFKEEIVEIKSRQEQFKAVSLTPPIDQPEVRISQSPNPSSSLEFETSKPPSNESPINFASSSFAPSDSIPVGGQAVPNVSPAFEEPVSLEPIAFSVPKQEDESPFMPKIAAEFPAAVSPDFILATGGSVSSETVSQEPASNISASQDFPSAGGGEQISPMALEGLDQSKPIIASGVVEPVESMKGRSQKTKKRVWLLIVIVVGVSLTALAYVLGLIPGLGETKPEPAVASHLSPPIAPSLSVSPQPRQPALNALSQNQEETFKNSAIRLVQNWPVGQTGKNVVQALGVPVVSSGSLSPWMAEKIKDNLYQVNFYALPSEHGVEKSYEFQADLALQKVVGQNQAAVSLLAMEASSPAVKKVSKKRVSSANKPAQSKKKRIVKKIQVSKKHHAKKVRRARGDIMPGIPRPKSVVKQAIPNASVAPLATKPSAQPSEDQSLDQLLKP